MRKRHSLLFTLLTLFMAVLMASMSTLQVFAGGRNKDKKTERDIAEGNLYVKDVIIVTESERSKLPTTDAYADYEVLSDPINTFSSGSGHENLYFAVKTTENPNEAITDIKAMNMNGDYSYDAYRQYLGEVEKWATAKATTTMTALEEFRANYAKGTPSATFAYNMLNYLIGDDENTPLGDFFVSDGKKSEQSIQVKNIVTKANLASLEYFRQLLLIGCSETSTDGSFVEKLRTHTKGNDLIPNESDKQYNTAAKDLMDSMGETRDTVKAYRKALSEHGDGLETYLKETQEKLEPIISDEDKKDTDEYKKAEEEINSVNKILSGKILCELFDEVYYTNNDGVQFSLSDILTKDPDAEEEADVLTEDMLLPVVALMSDGQRALCGCGFDKLVGSVINDYSADDSEANKMLGFITEFWQTISENGLISIYAGVDLSLYDPNGIAMVGKSSEFVKKDASMSAFGISDLAAGLMLGGSVVGIVGSAAMIRKGMESLSKFSVLDKKANELAAIAKTWEGYAKHDKSLVPKFLEKFNKYQEAEDAVKNSLNLKYSGQILKAFGYFMIVLSVALLVFSIVTFIMNASAAKQPGKYLQVPRVLVTAIEKEEYDERQQKTTSTQMVFYKGIVDPFMSDEKAKANVTPSKVQDVFDWSLTTHDREWIALYTTKDGRVGNPIIYDGKSNTLVTLVEANGKTYNDLEQEKGFNTRVNIFNKESYTACGKGVIVYDRDTEVTSETKTGLGASMNITNGYFILFLCLAIIAGAGIGVGMTLLVRKKRKNSPAAV